jgi:nicotinamide-nucleotide amidase
MENDLDLLTTQLHQLLIKNKLIVSTAESCTGGWVAKVLTDIAGSSASFERGFVTYSNDSKQDMLGVKAQTLQKYGAVSEQTVMEMAQGALKNSRASLSMAVSGIAGPSGGSEEKPVGTVWFAWSKEGQTTITQVHHFAGERESVRLQSVKQAILGLIQLAK